MLQGAPGFGGGVGGEFSRFRRARQASQARQRCADLVNEGLLHRERSSSCQFLTGLAHHRRMATKPKGELGEGDTVELTGEVSIVHDDGKVTIWLKGFDIPITIRAEHLSLIAKRAPVKPTRDKPN